MFYQPGVDSGALPVRGGFGCFINLYAGAVSVRDEFGCFTNRGEYGCSIIGE